ncbi:hypothetical protein GGQ79_003067 [Ochrobactrum pecoris]|uniref:Uncharacterized protein n=1 Tax=Brucella pecoris TaxID=867683 RepID=A0AB34YZF3_9HYPH|nr:hypothetical protein [Brucella pecoris]
MLICSFNKPNRNRLAANERAEAAYLLRKPQSKKMVELTHSPSENK